MDISGLSSYYNNLSSITETSESAKKISNLSEDEIKNASDEELMNVCKEFESYFLEQVFKEMEKTTSFFGDEDSSSSNQLIDYFKENTIQELASESTEQNSLGLAQMLYEQMKRNYNL